MKIWKRVFPVVLLSALTYGPIVHATQLTYNLNQTNTLVNGQGDGTIFGTVTLDDAISGQINFTVNLLAPLTSVADSNFGIDSFGFNQVGANTLTSPPDFNLPSNWFVRTSFNQDGFGNFDYVLDTPITGPGGGGGPNRQSPLNFSIITNLPLLTFYELSSGQAGEGNFQFAAHVAGFTNTTGSTSTFIAGGPPRRPPLDTVPEPTAVWMLGVGLLGLFGFSRRQAKSALQA